jgi:hypothetical protein
MSKEIQVHTLTPQLVLSLASIVDELKTAGARAIMERLSYIWCK